jgi:hypothetical protein
MYKQQNQHKHRHHWHKHGSNHSRNKNAHRQQAREQAPATARGCTWRTRVWMPASTTRVHTQRPQTHTHTHTHSHTYAHTVTHTHAHTFAAVPAPAGPSRATWAPIAFRTGRQERNTSRSPPHMIARVPAAAPSGPPLIGAGHTAAKPHGMRQRRPALHKQQLNRAHPYRPERSSARWWLQHGTEV